MLTDEKYMESDLTIGDYLMNIYIGKPKEQHVTAKEKLLIPSMSSGLTWIRSGSCSSNCNNQHPSLYDPKLSETYQDILFGSREYKDLQGTKRKGSNVCQYEYSFGNNQFSSSGVLGIESFYLKSPGTSDTRFLDIVFGCDQVHQGDFKDGVQGVVGLGQGPYSLASQVGQKSWQEILVLLG
ncbi:aspartic proteinase CDR1-like [Tripterygium wilfordii]|uniref:aspartic proteinase CDR1-like n=1 Tax=Tripterygium wilfordii TaxID=458696 RepID=UPI0018F806EA|nr:aspartic proteinase CDR1-like [Tripterygium wilfordii]